MRCFSNQLHVAMALVNNNLKPKLGEDTSQPWEWPLNYRGQVRLVQCMSSFPSPPLTLVCSSSHFYFFSSQQFTRWGDNDHRVYLLGNPIIFWGNLVCFALLAAAGVIYAALRQRGILVRCGRRSRGLSRLVSQLSR